VTNNQKEKLFSNKFIQNFLKNESTVSLKNNYKFAEIAFSLAYYLKSFSNVDKLLDYICLIFKHIFNENIILIIPLNNEGEIWHENIKISANNEFFKIQQEIDKFFNKFNFLQDKIYKIKEGFFTEFVRIFTQLAYIKLIELKKRFSIFNFNDLIKTVENTFLDSEISNSITLSKIQKRFKCVLIDEFQDTDNTQWNLIKKIFNTKNHF